MQAAPGVRPKQNSNSGLWASAVLPAVVDLRGFEATSFSTDIREWSIIHLLMLGSTSQGQVVLSKWLAKWSRRHGVRMQCPVNAASRSYVRIMRLGHSLCGLITYLQGHHELFDVLHHRKARA